jgi:hypothetical protein
MSGGGGGGGGDGDWRKPDRPVGGGDVGPDDPCNIVEVTNINSVDRAIAATLREGDELFLVYEPGPPQRLVATTFAGAIAGSITSPSMLQLIQCIVAGNAYVAVVLVVRGAQVQVRIQPR